MFALIPFRGIHPKRANLVRNKSNVVIQSAILLKRSHDIQLSISWKFKTKRLWMGLRELLKALSAQLQSAFESQLKPTGSFEWEAKGCFQYTEKEGAGNFHENFSEILFQEENLAQDWKALSTSTWWKLEIESLRTSLKYSEKLAEGNRKGNSQWSKENLNTSAETWNKAAGQ